GAFAGIVRRGRVGDQRGAETGVGVDGTDVHATRQHRRRRILDGDGLRAGTLVAAAVGRGPGADLEALQMRRRHAVEARIQLEVVSHGRAHHAHNLFVQVAVERRPAAHTVTDIEGDAAAAGIDNLRVQVGREI